MSAIVLSRLTGLANPAKLPPVLPLRGEQFNCLHHFPIKYGFGIIVLLNWVLPT
jgi:hypothetical protein